MKKIVILTGDDLRHNAFINFLKYKKNIKILKSFREQSINLKEKLKKKSNKISPKILRHLKNRLNSEKKFFPLNKKNKFNQFKDVKCRKKFFSTAKFLKQIDELKPDLIIVYGTSIIKGKILDKFKKRIINVHLGLSPYYRGSGTNYFPFVNSEPEYAGATFMYLNKGIDTGAIIHQIRPKIYIKDDFHSIGNRLICKMFKVYYQIIVNFEKVKLKRISYQNKKRLLFKVADFDSESLDKLDYNFKNKIINNYLAAKIKRDQKVKLIRQNWIK